MTKRQILSESMQKQNSSARFSVSDGRIDRALP